jgi:ribosomal protein L6P/L9E
MPYAKYLIINAGHTENLHQSLPVTLRSKTTKKDRKLTIFSSFKSEVSYLSKLVIQYRQPSVYTGRGIREKGTRVLRKAGKKDKQKGKSF